MSRAQLLLVEDDLALVDPVALYLRSAGHVVDHAADGLAALRCIEQQPCDVVLLALGQTGLDSFEVCRRLRERACYVPVIMLSVQASEADRVRGLELGADDFLSKPVSVRELLARVHALLRRVRQLRVQALVHAGVAQPHPGVQLGSLQIDAASRKVWLAGAALSLTLREFDLLYFLARHPGRIFGRGDLLQRVWGASFDGYEHTVNSHINRLRTKLAGGSGTQRMIETVWGLGYRFDATGLPPAAGAGQPPRLQQVSPAA